MTGLDYAWNRYYSATWGRFTSADPYVMSGGLGNPQGWNRYAYVVGDPVGKFDPSGLAWCLADYSMVWPGCYGGDGGGESDATRKVEPGDSPLSKAGGGGGGVTQPPFAAHRRILSGAVERAAELLEVSSDCSRLFPENSFPHVSLLRALDEDRSRVVEFGDNIPPGVGAQNNTAVGAIYVAANRYFFSGILADGTSVLDTKDFRGLTYSQMQQTIIIHELLHFLGWVGADNANQQITLPNGKVVTGSTGVTLAIKGNCFGVQE